MLKNKEGRIVFVKENVLTIDLFWDEHIFRGVVLNFDANAYLIYKQKEGWEDFKATYADDFKEIKPLIPLIDSVSNDWLSLKD